MRTETGIGTQRLIDEITDARKLDDRIEDFGCALAGEAQERGVHPNIFDACEIAVKTGTEFEKSGHTAIDSNTAFVGIDQTGDKTEQRAFTRAVSADDCDALTCIHLK